MLYLLYSVLKVNTQDIKSGRGLPFLSFHKTEGHFTDLLPFFRVYCLKGITKCCIRSGLDLHKNNDAPILGYDIDLPKYGPVIFLDNPEAFFFQKVSSNVLTFFTSVFTALQP